MKMKLFKIYFKKTDKAGCAQGQVGNGANVNS